MGQGVLMFKAWGEGIPVDDSGMMWKFPAAFLLIVALAFMRLQYGQRIMNGFRAYAFPRYMRQLTRDDLNIFHPYSILSLTLLCLSVGVLAYYFFRSSSYYVMLPEAYRFTDWVFMLLVAAGIMVIFVVRSFVYSSAFWLLGEDGGQLENRYAQVVFGQVTALVLTPLAVLALFADDPFLDIWCITGLGVFLLNYLYRLIRGIIAAINQQVNPLYIIYYLCTLEIVPAALVVGILTKPV